MTPAEIIDHLNLIPHPEGGHFHQTWVAESVPGERPTGTCIYFLLRAGEVSCWHRVDATEIWHFYAGSPIILSMAQTAEGPAVDHVLSPDLSSGQPQLIVPKGHWQAARSTGEYSLAGCTVSPGFQFDGFELAAPGFDIPRTTD